MSDLWKAIRVAVNLNNMDELEILEREAGLDPESQDYQLRQLLAQEDDNLLEELVRLRKAKGLSQQDVAERTNRHRSAVCNFERLGHDPHLSTIRRYAAAIGAYVRHEVVDADLVSPTEYRCVNWRSIVADPPEAPSSPFGEVWDHLEVTIRESVVITSGGVAECFSRASGDYFPKGEKRVQKIVESSSVDEFCR
ncbi:hypothetical protein TM48_04615 [Mycobacterium shottsii]|uniref:HTH cro/C1-type domain-containing protein n=1 Tax=Mycobacterium shottsii TaxID=133549 RepID=A0A7I7LKE0_9MYCO|nr:helix-turn-helix transcriptional regulator [Mycobacterium shottsii]QYL30054.1 hypothetical protein TM48_04615 [Mycobacterium shottsii]BBX60506.1 hypothetical protein MSHO_58510 [Mycobacterium shottsii]